MTYTVAITIPPMVLTYMNVPEAEVDAILTHWKGRAACYGRRDG